MAKNSTKKLPETVKQIPVFNACKIKTNSKNIPAGNCMFKVNNRNTTTRCKVSLKLAIKTPCSSVPIINFEQVL